MHLCHTFRDRAVFDLTCISFKLNEKYLMPAIGDGFEEAMIVRGVAEGEINEFHVQTQGRIAIRP
jgi:hypothetical protein